MAGTVPETAVKLSSGFKRSIQVLEKVLASGESAYLSRALLRRDLDHLYTSTFVEALASFEAFQNELFYSIVLGHSGIQDAKAFVQFRNRAEAERVVIGSDPFLTWTKLQSSVARAKLYIAQGRPYSRLLRRSSDLEILRIATIVRNAIAHQSGPAKDKFRGLSLGQLNTSRRSPAGFLQLTSQGKTQHVRMMNDLVRIALALSEGNARLALKWLGPEDPYQSGGKAPRGTYECHLCGSRVRKDSEKSSLVRCANCTDQVCATCGRSAKSKFTRVYSL